MMPIRAPEPDRRAAVGAAGGADPAVHDTGVRILVVVAVFVAGALVGGLVLLPRLVSWNDYRDQLTEQAAAITGQTVAMGGQIELELLPRPTLTLAEATLSSPSAAPAGRSLVVDRLDLRLKPLPLLRGRLEVDSVRLVRPVLRIEAPDASRAHALLLAGGGMLSPLGGGGGPARLTVVDGRALVGDGERSPEHAIEAINFEVGSAGPNGPYTLDGQFAIAAQPFGVTGRLGQIHSDSWSTLQVVVTAAESGSDPTVLSFRGLAWSDLAAPRLRGDMSLTGSSAEAGLDALGRALGGQLPVLPEWLAVPFRLGGHLDLVDDQASFAQLRVALGATEAEGSLQIGFAGPRPEFDLELDVPHLVVADAWPQDGAGLAPLTALAGLKGRIDLSVQALDWRGGTMRRLRTTLALTGPGQVTVEQARASLPGQTSVDFTGALAGQGADALLQGALAVVCDDLGKLLAWSGLEPTGVAAGRLRTLSLDSQLALNASTVRFTDAELRVDASRLSGSLALGLGARPQVAGALTLDRLDLDAYLPAASPAQIVERGLRLFGALDAALQARIERLTWRGLRLQQVALDARSVAGQLTLNDLSLQDAADTRGRIAGALDLERRSFDLSGTVQTARPLQLLRGLGVAPPLMLARLTPVSASGTAKGDLEAFDMALELHHDDTRLALEGEVKTPPAGPISYALALEGDDPDYRQLLERMALLVAPAAAGPAPLKVTAEVTGDLAGQTAAVGTAQLGAMSLTGQVDWQPAEPRPRLALRLSAGQPSADGLAVLAALAGVRHDSILLQPGPGGAWSTEPLAFGWLESADAEIELSAKGGLAGPGIELRAKLDQGRLMVDRLATALWGGRLDAQVSVDGARPLPFLALALDLRRVDAKALTAWLDLPPVVEGAADLYLEATTAGNSMAELVRGLIGEAKVGLHDGRLVGADLSQLAAAPATAATGVDGAAAAAAPAIAVPDLSGSFALKRGIASARQVRLELADTPVSVEGTVDLWLWAADLTLSPDPARGPQQDALELRLVGPLDRPQLRLRRPPAPPLPSQAP